jgi:hypothetical protein
LDFSAAEPARAPERETGERAAMDRAFSAAARELDRRSVDGIEVLLLWCADSDRLAVSVSDEKTGTGFLIDVREDERPLDVFRHPFAYAAWRRIRTDERSLAASRA